MSDLDAPGFSRIKRPSGREALYWVARKDLVKAGFTPKTVRLSDGDTRDPEFRSYVEARCRDLQRQMLEWAEDRPDTNGARPGTIAWWCKTFETHPDSSFRTRRADTQIFYRRFMHVLTETVGDKLIANATGLDVRRWHRNWMWPQGEGDGKPKQVRRAYGCIQTLRRVISFACEFRDKPCLEFSAVLGEMQFERSKPRTTRMTYAQCLTICDAAHRYGFPSLALAQTLQFELGLRQKDVIGEWVKDPSKGPGIRSGQWRWQMGLLWGDHIGPDLILRKPTSKSNGREIAEHDLKLSPDVLFELGHCKNRIGPVIIDERTGLPYLKHVFWRRFNDIRRAARVPDGVWNMDARSGHVSEAFEAGAEPADVMKSATHTQLSTTMGYNRGALEQTGRVTRLKVARREKKA